MRLLLLAFILTTELFGQKNVPDELPLPMLAAELPTEMVELANYYKIFSQNSLTICRSQLKTELTYNDLYNSDRQALLKLEGIYEKSRLRVEKVKEDVKKVYLTILTRGEPGSRQTELLKETQAAFVTAIENLEKEEIRIHFALCMNRFLLEIQ